MSVNRVTLIGNLGNDPELRYTASHKPVCNMSVATSERYQGQDGQQQERTSWHRVVVWDRQGENCGRYLRKGSRVYIEGRLSTRSYEDRDGNKRYTTEVVARRVVFLSTGRGAASSDAGGAATSFTGSARSEEATEQPQAAVGDELPF